MNEELVNHPQHYAKGDIECIDAMVASQGKVSTHDFCVLNAFKYIWRCKNKGCKKQDLEKASWYINKAIELL